MRELVKNIVNNIVNNGTFPVNSTIDSNILTYTKDQYKIEIILDDNKKYYNYAVFDGADILFRDAIIEEKNNGNS